MPLYDYKVETGLALARIGLRAALPKNPTGRSPDEPTLRQNRVWAKIACGAESKWAGTMLFLHKLLTPSCYKA